jgi:hypothetical protein
MYSQESCVYQLDVGCHGICLRYCCAHLVKQSLEEFEHYWNIHHTSFDPQSLSPSGIEDMYIQVPWTKRFVYITPPYYVGTRQYLCCDICFNYMKQHFEEAQELHLPTTTFNSTMEFLQLIYVECGFRVLRLVLYESLDHTPRSLKLRIELFYCDCWKDSRYAIGTEVHCACTNLFASDSAYTPLHKLFLSRAASTT